MKSASLTLVNSLDFRSWILAARVKTLGAGAIPVLLGSAVSYPYVRWSVFTLCLITALLLQVGCNFINDAADFEKGTDTSDRMGPARAAQLGLLTPKALYFGASFCLLLAFVLGSVLTLIAGWPILVIGLLSVLAAVAYTAGPFPLAYWGLGDLFVFIFFGLFAVTGTSFANLGEFSFDSALIGAMTGLHAVALIAINNTGDIKTDLLAGKVTISNLLGERSSKIYFSICLLLPYSLLFYFIFTHSKAFLAPLAFLPFAVFISKKSFSSNSSAEYINLLELSAKHQILFGLFFAATMFFF